MLDEKFERTIDYDVHLPSKGVNLQREFVWTDRQKSEFIKSILKGIDTGKMHLVDHEHSIFRVIDGKQRLSTVLDFIMGKFPVEHRGAAYYFRDLDSKCRYIVEDWSPRCEVGYSYDSNPITDEEMIEWFLRVNFAGTPQDEQHQDSLSGLLNA